MPDETKPTTTQDGPPQGVPAAARSREGGRIRQWLERVGLALERAEKRIMDGFRVPPHGG
ncbi:hypothetical protein HF896_10990 [Alicycliphilus denitrificans]|uniref:Uncharacterized protein n=2 Tax=Alicycliphilus denitrificans TaxID=179636 RepID=F4GE11_ALIDK|nr:hypothetical protein [Alicycliphilus denitrificans]ADV00088.1 hypothetical protein Alide_2353 [Alicycliphilus denitrificans BC]AEB84905.1 hypothetical protein Alide2_2547 [Alicycliphilus denitrificans K601]QKD44112.1 hypothetical protein HF896_10990 [Alicycliphilus denitrificans]GAO23212.1 hypothetical protein ALISP_3032 [Alicycliphilus sp. B1]